MADLDVADVEFVPCCRWLQTKMQHCAGVDMRVGPGRVRISETATYWCEQTSTSFGPDDAPAVPERCQPGRGCHEPA